MHKILTIVSVQWRMFRPPTLAGQLKLVTRAPLATDKILHR